MPVEQLHANPDVLPHSRQQLTRDHYLRLASVDVGGQAVIDAADMQTVGRSYSFEDATEQRLLAVVNAGGVNFNVVETEVNNQCRRLLTQAPIRPTDRPKLVGFIDDKGLPVRGASQTEGERPLFTVATDERGSLLVENTDRLSIDIALRRQEEASPVVEEGGKKGMFSVTGIVNGLRRAARMHRRQQQPAEKPYHDVVQNWAVPATYIREAAHSIQPPSKPVPLRREIYPMSSESKVFWEKGRARQAPHFSEQLNEVRSNPEARPTRLAASVNGILGTPEQGTKLYFTEAEAIVDLDDFLQKAAKTARDTHDDALANQVATFREHFSFLGTPEYQEACTGIAQAWVQYVSQSPEHIINVYNPTYAGRHSYNVVYESIMREFTAMTEGLPVADRVKTDSASWVEGNDSKLVIVDDWMITGKTMENMMGRAVAEASRVGKHNLPTNAEVHILIAGKGQVDRPRSILHAGGRDLAFDVRAFYEASTELLLHETAISGAHSSIDYGFQNSLEAMWSKMLHNKVYTPLPMLANILRRYYDDDGYAPGHAAMLEAIANANAASLAARQQMAAAHDHVSHYRTRLNEPGVQDNLAAAEVEAALRTAEERKAYDIKQQAKKAYYSSPWYSELPR